MAIAVATTSRPVSPMNYIPCTSGRATKWYALAHSSSTSNITQSSIGCGQNGDQLGKAETANGDIMLHTGVSASVSTYGLFFSLT